VRRWESCWQLPVKEFATSDEAIRRSLEWFNKQLTDGYRSAIAFRTTVWVRKRLTIRTFNSSSTERLSRFRFPLRRAPPKAQGFWLRTLQTLINKRKLFRQIKYGHVCTKPQRFAPKTIRFSS
jgi:hypothetical protein